MNSSSLISSIASRSVPSPHKVVMEHRYGKDPIMYPMQSLSYILSHRQLWGVIIRIACIGIMISIIVLVVLLATALKPQAQAINADLVWWAWLIAVFLVLFEAGIISVLLMSVSQSKAQTDAFVTTMKLEGVWREDMIAQSIAKDLNPIKKAFIVRLLTLPIQIIPFIGGGLFAAINATFIGWDHMDRYFDAIKLSSKLQRVEIFGEELSDCRALCNSSTYDIDNEYARFGFFCGLFESTPLVGWVLVPVTNAIAAALWACDIEKSGGLLCLREQAKAEREVNSDSSLQETNNNVEQYNTV